MRFFATAEAYKDVSRKLVIIQNIIVSDIRILLNSNSYGKSISYWGHISICCPSEFYDAGFFKEIKKYTKKNKEVELRLKIDYEAMFKADEKEVFRLICESVLRGVDVAENELKIKGFDFEAFRKDLTSLFKKEGWI